MLSGSLLYLAPRLPALEVNIAIDSQAIRKCGHGVATSKCMTASRYAA